MLIHYFCNRSNEVGTVHKGSFMHYFLALLTETESPSLCNQVVTNDLRKFPLLTLAGYGDIESLEPSMDTSLVSYANVVVFYLTFSILSTYSMALLDRPSLPVHHLLE